MESIQDDPIDYYKRLEAEINKAIQSPLNCRDFTKAVGKAMDAHLSRIRIHRKLVTRWLKDLDIPNKDELADISIRMVDCEEILDISDEAIYAINKLQKENLQQLSMVRKSLEELLLVLQAEANAIKGNKLQSLERELKELQQLFYLE